ncbi:MAG: hypothetical protein JPMHGGIA_02258 [Saprospiraceae bacterium]|nr:hypothetical protein [Saprospiraceae bacterium]
MNGIDFWKEFKTWFAKYVIFLAISAITLSLSYLSFRKSYSTEQKINNFSSIISNLSDHRIDSTIIDSLKRKIVDLKLEQETYTKMLDRQSDWFILYVSLLFVIISIFGFIISQKTVSDIKRRNNKDYKRQNEIHAEFVNEFNNLKFEVYDAIAKLNFLESMHSVNNISKEDRKDLPDLLATLIKGMEYQLKSFILRPEDKARFDSLEIGFVILP